jgi:nitroimidazol reductase NimA-like FMN-containing flavoprotein (pyridoxamine 5'-phosphate oxidase superfamily)
MSFHVRRKDREITDPDALKAILKTTKYVTVALSMNNEPYLVALSHGYDENKNCLYFHCASEGKKITYLKANNKIWGQAVLTYEVSDDCDYAYSCVHFQGTIHLLTELTEKQHAMQVLVRQLSNTPEAKLAKIKPEKLDTTTMGRIDISSLTGKQHKNPDAFSRKVN